MTLFWNFRVVVLYFPRYFALTKEQANERGRRTTRQGGLTGTKAVRDTPTVRFDGSTVLQTAGVQVLIDDAGGVLSLRPVCTI